MLLYDQFVMLAYDVKRLQPPSVHLQAAESVCINGQYDEPA